MTRGWMEITFDGYDPDHLHETRHAESDVSPAVYPDEIGFEVVWCDGGGLNYADCKDADGVNVVLNQLGIDPDTGWK